jgi:hypothetical protein
MTGIERLRDDLEMLAEHPFNAECCNASFPIAALRRACQESIALLADYERLRGMEERVKGAAVGEWRGCEQSWKAGGSMEVKYRVLDINYHAPMRVALVPVPGGEGK